MMTWGGDDEGNMVVVMVEVMVVLVMVVLVLVINGACEITSVSMSRDKNRLYLVEQGA